MAELAGLLQQVGVTHVIDVRTIPRSRTNPQFNADTLPQSLMAWQIGYQHLRDLGGLRGRRKDQGLSPNTYWDNLSFRNYADYTATAPFQAGLQELRKLGGAHVCAVMCAEAVWWRCHRRIITDYLISEEERVCHIMGPDKLEPATLNPAAVQQHDGTWFTPRGRRGMTKGDLETPPSGSPPCVLRASVRPVAGKADAA